MRVSAEKQTLILAGELVPRRGLAYAVPPFRTPLTVIATPVDEPPLLAALSAHQVAAYRSANRTGTSAGADAYARTQQLSAANARIALIDTYA